MKQIIYILILLGISCSNHSKMNSNKFGIDSIKKVVIPTIKYIYLDKLFIIGDFDGDGLKDTLIQNNISGKTKMSIDSFPENQYDSLDRYFDRLEADIILKIKNQKTDTLHLGSGSGLFCLINIGDNNNDKKDEIALVVDHCDFTNISTCEIYSLYKTKWIILKTFKVHENAFTYRIGTKPNLNQINGFLEHRKTKWMYIDYYEWFNAQSDKDTIMKPLKIKRV
jgi:hypothetical protein